MGTWGQGPRWDSRVETGLLPSHSVLPCLSLSSLSLLCPRLPLFSQAEWILLHLHPGQRLLLGINKSWGFLLSQLRRGRPLEGGLGGAGDGSHPPWAPGQPTLSAKDPMQVPGTRRAPGLLAGSWQGTVGSPELRHRAVSRGQAGDPCWGSLRRINKIMALGPHPHPTTHTPETSNYSSAPG